MAAAVDCRWGLGGSPQVLCSKLRNAVPGLVLRPHLFQCRLLELMLDIVQLLMRSIMGANER